MRRFAAFIFALLMLLLGGCTFGRIETTTTAPSISSQPTAQPTTEPASAHTQPTSTEPTQPTTIPINPSTEPHVHSYTSSVVKKATCTAEGTKKYTCSCGDSYTEAIKAKGHTWGKWLQIVTSNTLDPTGTYRICSACKAEERSMNYSAMLKKYVTLVGFLNSYTSPDQISAKEVATALPMILSVLPEFTDDPNIATRTYPVKELNACAMKCFGRTFDFSVIQNESVHGYGTISYDAGKDALIWKFPYGQDHQWNPAVYEKHSASDNNTKFTVLYHYEYPGGYGTTYSFTVELINGNYVITSISQ